MPKANPERVAAINQLIATVRNTLNARTPLFGDAILKQVTATAYAKAILHEEGTWINAVETALLDMVDEYDIRLCECGESTCYRGQDLVTNEEQGISSDCAAAREASIAATTDAA